MFYPFIYLQSMAKEQICNTFKHYIIQPIHILILNLGFQLTSKIWSWNKHINDSGTLPNHKVKVSIHLKFTVQIKCLTIYEIPEGFWQWWSMLFPKELSHFMWYFELRDIREYAVFSTKTSQYVLAREIKKSLNMSSSFEKAVVNVFSLPHRSEKLFV